MNEVQDNPVFVFTASEQLSGEQSAALLARTHEFLQNWNSHGQPLMAEASVEESRFLVLEMKDGSASGCSKDKLFRMLEEVAGRLNFSFDSSGNFFLSWQGKIVSMSRKNLKDNMLNPDFSENARLFPVWISSSGELKKRWKKPISSFPDLFPETPFV